MIQTSLRLTFAALAACASALPATAATLTIDLEGVPVVSPGNDVGNFYQSMGAVFAHEDNSGLFQMSGATGALVNPAVGSQVYRLTSPTVDYFTLKIDPVTAQFNVLQFWYFGAFELTVRDTNNKAVVFQNFGVSQSAQWTLSNELYLDPTLVGLIKEVEFKLIDNGGGAAGTAMFVDAIRLDARNLGGNPNPNPNPNPTPTPSVPEPGSLALAALALFGVFGQQARQKR